MNNASPAPFLPPRSPAVPGRGLAPYEVLDVSIEDDIDDLPVSTVNPCLAADEFGGLFIALSVAMPAGLAFWAAVIAVLIWQ